MSTCHRIACVVALSALLALGVVGGAVAADSGSAVGEPSLADESPPAGLAAQAEDHTNETTGRDATTRPERESAGSTRLVEGPEGVRLDPALESASGEVQVIVHFENPDRRALQRSDDAVATLQERSAASDRALEAFASRHRGVDVRRSFWITNAALVTVDADRTDPTALARVDGVTELHPNYEGEFEVSGASTGRANAAGQGIESISNATSAGYNVTYGLDMVGAPAFWDRYDTQGANATVAVIDSGINASHQDLTLAENGWAEFDEEGNRINSTPQQLYYYSHGTHVSGTVAGGNASGTYIGVAPEAKLMVAGAGTNLSVASTYASIEWAIEHENDVDVITASLGFGEGVDPLQEPIRNARLSGIVFVGSAGNSEAGTATTPGDSYDGINVGAVDRYGEVADFSSSATIDASEYWTTVPEDWPEQYTVPTVTAPGVDVCSSVGSGGYECDWDGTSMAAPHVAGTAALLRSANPNMSVDEIRLRLSRAAMTPANLTDAPQIRYGHGIVNVSRAGSIGVGSVNGTVLANGSAVEGASVRADTGIGTTTDVNGTYEIALQSGNRTLTYDAFGYAAVNRSINLTDGARVTETVEFTRPTPEIELVTSLPTSSDPGETVSTTVRVGGARNLTVRPAAGFSDPANTSLSVGGNASVGYNDTVTIAPDSRTVTVNVTTDPDYHGGIEVEVVAAGSNESTTATSGPTVVLDDSVRYPTDVPDSIGLGTVVDGIGPNATVVVEDGTYTVGGDRDDDAAVMALATNATLRAAAGASPVVRIEDRSAVDSGILVGGNESTVSGIDVRGDGIEHVLYTTGYDVTVRDLALHNGTYGLRADGGSVDAFTGTVVSDTAYGLDMNPDAPSGVIANNRVLNASEWGIYHLHGYDRLENNTVTMTSAASIGVLVDAYGVDAGPVTNNSITSASADTAAIVVWETENRTFVRDNIVEGGDGIVLDDDGLATVEGNVLSNVSTGIHAHGYQPDWDDAAHVIANNTVRNASERGIFVEEISGPTVRDNDLSGAGIDLHSVHDATVRNTTVANASTGVTLRGEPDAYDDLHTRNVTVVGTNASDLTGPAIEVRAGSAAVTAAHQNATVVLSGTGGYDELPVQNATLSGEATVSANGTNATISTASAPNGSPANRTRVGPTLSVGENGTNGWANLTVDLSEANLDHVYNGTISLYRHGGGNWSAVGSNRMDGDRVVARNVTRFDTVAAFGEASGTLRGRVVDAGGSPVANATIVLHENETRLGTIVANESGEFAGPAPISATHGAATRWGFYDDVVPIEVSENGTARANFTIQRKPIYVVPSNLSTDGEVYEDYEYTATATVENVGTSDATTTVQYLVDGEVVANRTVTIGARSTTTVSFTHTVEYDGGHDHRVRTVNETTPERNFYAWWYAPPPPGDGDDGGSEDGGGGGGGGGFALPPAEDSTPEFSIASVDLGSSEVEVGESVIVEVQVENDGDADGEYTTTLFAGGDPVDSATASVNANWESTLTLSTSFDEPGTYRLSVDDESAGTITVVGQPDVSLTNASVEPSTVAPGDPVTVAATFENAGTVEGTTEVALAVDGQPAETVTLRVPAGESETVTFDHAFETAGTRTLAVDGTTAGTVTVEAPEPNGTTTDDGSTGEDGSDGENGSDEGDSGSGNGLPGFGPVVALLGLLGGALLARRRP